MKRRFAELAEMTQEQVEQRLRDYEEQYKAGDPYRLVNALNVCINRKLPPPEWVSAAVFAIVRANEKPIPTRGRTGNPTAKNRQTAIHLVRWAAVYHLLKNCRERAPTWKAAYVEASLELRGTPAQGSSDTMAASYKIGVRYLRRLREEGMRISRRTKPLEYGPEEAKKIFENREMYFRRYDTSIAG